MSRQILKEFIYLSFMEMFIPKKSNKDLKCYYYREKNEDHPVGVTCELSFRLGTNRGDE